MLDIIQFLLASAMLEMILFLLAGVVLLAATITDLATREVPDWLSYAFLAGVGGIRLIYALGGDWWQFAGGIAGAAVFWMIGYTLYKMEQWGGGDTKLLLGMGAALGIALPWSEQSLSLGWYFILLLFSGAGIGVIWIAALALKHRAAVWPAFLKQVQEQKSILWLTLVFTLLISAIAIFLPLFWLLAGFPLLVFFTFVLVQIVEQKCLLKKIATVKLTEGDWLAEEVRHNGKLLVPVRTITRGDINQLQKQGIPTVTIKEGIPFIPAFLLAYALFIWTMAESFL